MSNIDTNKAKTGLIYLSLFISSIFWIGSDIFFLTKITKIKNNEKRETIDNGNYIKKTSGNALNMEIFFIILLLMMEFVFKYKLSSVLGSFSGRSTNLIIIMITCLFVLPSFISYNIIETNQIRTYKIKTLNNLIGFHSVNLIIKIGIIAACFIPAFKDKKFINFFKSTKLNYGSMPNALPTNTGQAKEEIQLENLNSQKKVVETSV